MGSSTSKPLHFPEIRAFSLLELIAVLAVIAILSVVAMGVMDGVRERSFCAQTEAELVALRGALQLYRMEFGGYPVVVAGDGESSASALFEALQGRTDPDGIPVEGMRPFVDAGEFELDDSGSYFVDAWGNALYYAYSEQWIHGQYFLISCGPDGLADFPGKGGAYPVESQINMDNLEGLGRG